MTDRAYITPKLFAFFRELRENNNRDWFQANKKRYEENVREPLLKFIIDFGVRLAEISPHYVADARKKAKSLGVMYALSAINIDLPDIFLQERLFCGDISIHPLICQTILLSEVKWIKLALAERLRQLFAEIS